MVWKVKGRKELWYGRWKAEKSCDREGGRWKGAAVWKVGGGKELYYGRLKEERSCRIKGER